MQQVDSIDNQKPEAVVDRCRCRGKVDVLAQGELRHLIKEFNKNLMLPCS
jgi:hypothetical protein